MPAVSGLGNSSACTLCLICVRCFCPSFSFACPRSSWQKLTWARSGLAWENPCHPGAQCYWNSIIPPSSLAPIGSFFPLRSWSQYSCSSNPLPPRWKQVHSSLRSSLLFVGLTGLLTISAQSQAAQRQPGEVAWAIHYDPKTFDPAKVDEQASELVRYLTGGVLLRLNRQTNEPVPHLAQSFHITPDGLLLVFKLRDGLRFSDGAPLTSADVAWSLRRVLAPSTESVVAAEFLAPEKVTIDTPDR